MSAKIDMTGWKMWEHDIPNSKIEVLSFERKDLTQGNMWKCRCQCGNIFIVSGYAVRKGRTKSCGCIGREKTKQRNIKNIKNIIGYKSNNLLVLEDLGLRKQESRDRQERWVKCQCLLCNNIFEVRWNNIKTGVQKSCGCLNSYGEQVITNILNNNKINYKKQYTFSDLIGERGNKLRFDFGILDEHNNLIKLIEFDGRQHFTGPEGNWTHTNSLEKIKELDERKNQYCKNNNIILQRIPYTELKNITISLLLKGIEEYYA